MKFADRRLALAGCALRAAARAGVRCLFNPSPVVPEFPWGEVASDTVIVDEHECAEIFGAPEPPVAARCGVRHLFVTRGSTRDIRAQARHGFGGSAMRVHGMSTKQEHPST